jgi:putative MATE family efflux protein
MGGIMVTSKELREDHVLSLILRFSGPAIAGMIMMSIYNIVDRIFIGHSVGTLGIAGLAVAYPLMMVKGALGMLIGWGAASLISLRLGEGRHEEAEKIMANALTLTILFAIVASGVSFIFLEQLMRLFGASDNILPFALAYMRIILVGNLFHLMGANNMIRAEGNPRVAMWTNFIGAGSNIILDALFILVLDMGVTGAAIATAIAQFLSSSYVVVYFLRGKSVLRLYVRNLKLSLSHALEILHIGMPLFLRTIVNSLVVIILNNSLQRYGGDIAVSAMGVIFSIDSLLLLPLMGLSNGVQPVIGFNYGAQQFDRVKHAFYFAVGLATAVVGVVYLVIMIWPAFFLRLFTTSEELIQVGSQGIRLFMLLIPLLGFQSIGSNYFQATGRPRQSILLNLTRQAIFLIPAMLIIPRFLDLRGVWLAQPAADFLAFLLTGVFIFFEMRSLDRRQKEVLLNASKG